MAVRGLSFQLLCCITQCVGLRFMEVQLRASVLSRWQYAAVFAPLTWDVVQKLHDRVQTCRLRRLGLWTQDELLVAMLPTKLGGMDLRFLHVEGQIISMAGEVLALLNQDDDECKRVLKFLHAHVRARRPAALHLGVPVEKRHRTDP